MLSASPGFQVFGSIDDLQRLFDVTVVITSLGRPSLTQALASICAQQQVQRIQVLLGFDVTPPEGGDWRALLEALPAHVSVGVLWPGYSTSQRHGGLHRERCGGALRCILTYLANARHVAYLDDDNHWEPQHLRSLLDAVQGRDWAFSLRWFNHPQSGRPVCIDTWESTGPGRGLFAARFGGFVDPNCLIIDKLRCEGVIAYWTAPEMPDVPDLPADRYVYHWLQQKSAPGETGMATVHYLMQASDVNHALRVQHAGDRYAAAAD